MQVYGNFVLRLFFNRISAIHHIQLNFRCLHWCSTAFLLLLSLSASDSLLSLPPSDSRPLATIGPSSRTHHTHSRPSSAVLLPTSLHRRASFINLPLIPLCLSSTPVSYRTIPFLHSSILTLTHSLTHSRIFYSSSYPSRITAFDPRPPTPVAYPRPPPDAQLVLSS